MGDEKRMLSGSYRCGEPVLLSYVVVSLMLLLCVVFDDMVWCYEEMCCLMVLMYYVGRYCGGVCGLCLCRRDVPLNGKGILKVY